MPGRQLFLEVTTETLPGTKDTFLLPHLVHFNFSASCPEIVSVSSNVQVMGSTQRRSADGKEGTIYGGWLICGRCPAEAGAVNAQACHGGRGHQPGAEQPATA